MFVGWMLIPITICTVFRKVENNLILAFAGALLAFTYCWCYLVPNYFMLHIKPMQYLKTDFIFECILATSSFISIQFLYNPVKNIFIKFRIGKIDNDEEIIDINYTDE